jgi:hypothetical protein
MRRSLSNWNKYRRLVSLRLKAFGDSAYGGIEYMEFMENRRPGMRSLMTKAYELI